MTVQCEANFVFGSALSTQIPQSGAGKKRNWDQAACSLANEIDVHAGRLARASPSKLSCKTP